MRNNKHKTENNGCNCENEKQFKTNCSCGDNCNCGEDKKCDCHSNENQQCNCKNDCNNSSKEQEYIDMAKRIAAEFENYKRRTKEEVKESFDNGISYAVTKILPVIDSFKQAKSQITDESLIAGIDLIHSQLLNSLKDLGVTKIEAVGKPFDPNYHNAIMVDSTVENEVQMVLDEFQEGFMLNNKVIRYSVVKISK